MLNVTYLDHSGFAVTTPAAIMVFDYYKDPDKKLEHLLKISPEKPVLFFVTHHHPGHFDTSIFELAQDRKRTYILSNDIFSKVVPKKGISVAWMSAGDVIDSIPGTKEVRAFGSTDSGTSYAITLEDGSVIFHGGDLYDLHRGGKTTEHDIQKEEAKFNTVVNRIAELYPEVKIAFFPVDASTGDDFAKGATTFLSKVKVDNFFPTHLWGEPQKACDFASYVPPTYGTHCYCLESPGKTVEIK